MKIFSTLILIVVLSLASFFIVNAQTAETIWLQASTTTYKTNETVTITINGISATPIQGFTAQIRYDPSCLQPVNSISPISGMNGLAVPQEAGLVDASFASTTPQVANVCWLKCGSPLLKDVRPASRWKLLPLPSETNLALLPRFQG